MDHGNVLHMSSRDGLHKGVAFPLPRAFASRLKLWGLPRCRDRCSAWSQSPPLPSSWLQGMKLLLRTLLLVPSALALPNLAERQLPWRSLLLRAATHGAGKAGIGEQLTTKSELTLRFFPSHSSVARLWHSGAWWESLGRHGHFQQPLRAGPPLVRPCICET